MKIRLRALAVLAAAGLCLGAGGTALAAEGPLPAAARAVGTFEELKAALDHCHDILGAEGDLLLSQGSAGGT